MDEGLISLKSDEETMFKKNLKKSAQGYVQIEYGDFKLKTKVVDMQMDRILWDQVIKIPIPEPRVSDKLIIKMFDKDTTSGDDLIGTYELNLEDVIPAFADIKDKNSNKFQLPKKIHFYGADASEGGEGGLSDLMNNNSEIGMTYKGSLLMKVLREEPGSKPSTDIYDFKRIPSEIEPSSNDSWSIKLRVYSYYSYNDKTTKDGTQVKFYIAIGNSNQAFSGVN